MRTRLRLNEDDIEEKYIEQNGNIFEWLAHQAKSGVASAKMNLVRFYKFYIVHYLTGRDIESIALIGFVCYVYSA